MLKFSIITPSFNQGEFIEENIQSVLAQNYHNFEHIIVDGGSTDNTIEILRKYNHLNWLSEPDRGQTHALNKGIKKVTGDIICWLNSDDLLCEGAFDTVNSFFCNNPDKYIVVGGILIVDEFGNQLWQNCAQKIDYDGLLNKGQRPQQPSTFFRKEVFGAVGLFNENYHYCMDYDFWVRAAKKFKFYKIGENLGMFRRYPGTKTISNELGFVKEIIKIKHRYKANILSFDNIRLFYAIIANPFKKISKLRRFVRKLKGKNSDYIYGGP